MRYRKFFIVLPLCLTLGFLSCAKEEKKAEAPKQEQVTKNLVPSKTELKDQNFSAEVSDLQVVMNVDPSSKEIVETPSLRGHIKITNQSKDILDIQAVTLDYLDEGGKPIVFSSGEKMATVSSFWRALKPQEVVEGSLDVTIPRKAIKENRLGKIEINLVYVPSPLKRDTLTMPEKVES